MPLYIVEEIPHPRVQSRNAKRRWKIASWQSESFLLEKNHHLPPRRGHCATVPRAILVKRPIATVVVTTWQCRVLYMTVTTCSAHADRTVVERHLVGELRIVKPHRFQKVAFPM